MFGVENTLDVGNLSIDLKKVKVLVGLKTHVFWGFFPLTLSPFSNQSKGCPYQVYFLPQTYHFYRKHVSSNEMDETGAHYTE